MMFYAKVVVLSLGLSLWVEADENLSLRLIDFENRLEVLEKYKKRHKGIVQLRSVDTTLLVGGKVSMDTIYLHNASGKVGGSNSSDQFFSAGSIPIDTKGENGELSLTARDSKFWMKTRTKYDEGIPLMTLLEVDFWGNDGNEKNSNSHNIRLRHAYFIYNGWTIGQTNSFFVGVGTPSTLHAPVDNVFMRQVLIAYSKVLGRGSLSFSFEQPESVIMTSLGQKNAVNDDKIPDIIMKYQYYDTDWGDGSLSFLAREIRIDQEPMALITDSAYAYGLNFGTKLYIYSYNNLTFGMVGGKGIGRYMGTSFFPDAVITENGDLKAQSSWGIHWGYEHFINSKLRLSMARGQIWTNNILGLEEIDKSAYSTHLSLHYNPIKRVLFGVEYIHGARRLESGQQYSVDRLYLRGSYDF